VEARLKFEAASLYAEEFVMYKISVAAAVLFLSGCATTGEWRALNIDGSSDAAFRESLTRLNYELPYSRSRMFELALVDIANTRVQSAGETDDGSPAYSEDDFRSDLNGLTYEEVIEFADQSGPSIKTLYSSRSWGARQSEVNRLLTVSDRPFYPRPPPAYRDTHSGYVWPVP
jgi:hypothetical protein